MEAPIYEATVELEIDNGRCDRCRLCLEACPAEAIREGKGGLQIDRVLCILCYGCVVVCPRGAISVRRSYRPLGRCVLRPGPSE